MTASQRPERVDRDALRDAAKRAAYDAWRDDNDMPPVSDDEWEKARLIGGQSDIYAVAILDAVLPLIADAIEAEADRRRASMAAISWGGLTHDPTSAHYLRRAARLVRSLGGEQ